MSSQGLKESQKLLQVTAAAAMDDVAQVVAALKAGQRSAKEGGDPLRALMQAWLQRGQTGQLPRGQAVLRTWVGRAEEGTVRSRGLQAAKKLLDAHLAVEALVADVSAECRVGPGWRDRPAQSGQ